MTHGPVPRCLGFPINNKLRLLALKTLLSAKLFEDKVVFVDTEKIEYPKTTFLQEIVQPYGRDRIVMLTPFDMDKNFDLASKNIKNLTVRSPQTLNLPDILHSDYIFMTKQGAQEFEEVLEKRHNNYFRNRKVSN